MFAVGEGQTEIVQLLLKGGADASLDFAKKNGHGAVVALLQR